jgi:hypothetical protein
MDQLHEHEFTLLLVDVPSNFVQTCLHICASLATGAWLFSCPNTPSFLLSSTHFLTTLYICLGIPHHVVHLSWCKCGHTINDLGIHLLHCPCGSEHIASHGTFRDTVAPIASKSGAHIQKQILTFSPPHMKMSRYCHHQK